MQKVNLNNEEKDYLILALITALFLFIRFSNIIVFENPKIKHFIFIIAYISLLLLFYYSFLLPKLFLKIISGFVIGTFSLFGFFFLLFSFFEMHSISEWKGKDLSFECINEINHHNSKIKVYRTNGGATTSFGIVVREEKEILPGIFYANKLFNKYRMDTLGLQVEGNNLLLLDIRDKNKVIKKISLAE
jgi:hypothetical protein